MVSPCSLTCTKPTFQPPFQPAPPIFSLLSFALAVLGRLYSWGGNDKGQLGLGDKDCRLKAAQVTLLRRESGGLESPHSTQEDPFGQCVVERQLTVLGLEHPHFCPAGPMSMQDQDMHVVSVSCGPFHSAAVTAVGELHTCKSRRCKCDPSFFVLGECARGLYLSRRGLGQVWAAGSWGYQHSHLSSRRQGQSVAPRSSTPARSAIPNEPRRCLAWMYPLCRVAANTPLLSLTTS